MAIGRFPLLLDCRLGSFTENEGPLPKGGLRHHGAPLGEPVSPHLPEREKYCRTAEKKVESGSPQSKIGTSVNSSNSGFQQIRLWKGSQNPTKHPLVARCAESRTNLCPSILGSRVIEKKVRGETANMKCSEEVRSTTKRSAKSPASPGLLHPAGMIIDLPTFEGGRGCFAEVNSPTDRSTYPLLLLI